MDPLAAPLGDEDLVDEYTNGYCHWLALALHDLLGMRIGLIADEGEFRHYVAFFDGEPDMVVDINGRRPLGEVLSDIYLQGHNPDPELVPQTRAGLLSEMSYGDTLARPNEAGLEEAAALAGRYAQRLGMRIDQGRLTLFLQIASRPVLGRVSVAQPLPSSNEAISL